MRAVELPHDTNVKGKAEGPARCICRTRGTKDGSWQSGGLKTSRQVAVNHYDRELWTDIMGLFYYPHSKESEKKNQFGWCLYLSSPPCVWQTCQADYICISPLKLYVKFMKGFLKNPQRLSNKDWSGAISVGNLPHEPRCINDQISTRVASPCLIINIRLR